MEATTESPKKRRGRPPKAVTEAVQLVEQAAQEVAKKRRGRPPKAKPEPNGNGVADLEYSKAITWKAEPRRHLQEPGIDRELSMRTHLTGFIIACNQNDRIAAEREYAALVTMLGTLLGGTAK
jgi:hypothetical protein